MPFQMIPRDIIHGLLLSAGRMYKRTGCFVAAVVFARRIDADDYLLSVQPARYDQLHPQLITAPGGMFAVVIAQLEQPSVPTNVPCAGHIAKFHQNEMNMGSTVELSLKLETKIAEMAFDYYKLPPVLYELEEDTPEARLGRLVRRMREIPNSRLVCASENGHEFWYVLQVQGEQNLIMGSDKEPDVALLKALKEKA